MTTLDQLIYGIRMQESGGDYNALNSYGAVGAYQVLKSNVPGWTRRALGYSMTWQQFRASRSAQDAVARYMLGNYYRKYGARGAAAAWYAGEANHGLDMSTRAQNGGPSIKGYVDSVLAHASQSGLQGGGASVSITSSGGGGGGATVPKLDDRTMAAMYGMSYAEMKAVPELMRKLHQAVKEGWSGDLWTAHLKNTHWWKTTSQTQRQYFDLRYGDPATFKSKWDASAYTANTLAVKAGLGSLLGKGTTQGHMNGVLQDATYKLLALGWSEDRVEDWLAGQAKMHGGIMWGEAGDAYDQLHQLAWQNGLKLSSSWYQKKAVDVAAGRSTIHDQEADIRRTAAAKYAVWGEKIKAGQNVMDLAAPYIKTVSDLLEVPDSSIDLNDHWVNKAMTGKNEKGGAYSIWQLENDIRSGSTLWRRTKNAQDSTMAVAHQVLQNFGLTY